MSKEPKTFFVEKYNKQNIPSKYKFYSNSFDVYFWKYEISNIHIKILIYEIKDNSIKFICQRNNNFKEIEIVEPSYTDIYNAVYQFLVETVTNAEALAGAEANMKF